MEKIFDDFCKFLERERLHHVELLADRRLQLEVWFEVELYMLLHHYPEVRFETEREYPDMKGWFADLKIEEGIDQKSLIEVKVRLLKKRFLVNVQQTRERGFPEAFRDQR